MQNEQTNTDLGKIKIHKNVIASIASLAAGEIEGVKRIGTNFKAGLLGFAGKKSYLAIRVEFDKNGEVKVDIPLIIKYGYNIPEVADKVQENVRNALEKMSNLSVKNIDISIQAIERGA